MSRTVAEQLVETLAQAGVQRIYGLVGDSLNPVTDALHRSGKVDWVHVRHEETAAFAAGAEAQLTGKLAVCAGSCGPGNLHLINGLFDAHRSMAPVLAIASHIVTDPNALAMPPRATIQQAAGFALAMTKLAFGGKTDDVLDTVAANWRELL